LRGAEDRRRGGVRVASEPLVRQGDGCLRVDRVGQLGGGGGGRLAVGGQGAVGDARGGGQGGLDVLLGGVVGPAAGTGHGRLALDQGRLDVLVDHPDANHLTADDLEGAGGCQAARRRRGRDGRRGGAVGRRGGRRRGRRGRRGRRRRRGHADRG